MSGKVFFDDWNPKYPTELDSYLESGQNLNAGFFAGLPILDQSGNVTPTSGPNSWSPINTTLIEDTKRNTYSASFGFSQILSKNAQIALFFDVVKQDG